jgi:hypothetical protein
LVAVPTTEYVVVTLGVTAKVAVVGPDVQVYELTPLAVKVVDEPLQIAVGLAIDNVGLAKAVTVLVELTPPGATQLELAPFNVNGPVKVPVGPASGVNDVTVGLAAEARPWLN